MPESRARTTRSTIAVSLLMVLITGAAFAGAVVWAGGIDAVLEMVGIQAENPEPTAGPAPSVPGAYDPADKEEPSTVEPTATPSAEESATDVAEESPDVPSTPSGTSAQAVFPVSSAQAAMYREQLQSQGQLLRLVNGEVASVALGTTSVSASRATVPLTVAYRDGTSVSGSMSLSNSDGLWYFAAIGTGSPPTEITRPRAVDSGVVRVIAEQQGSAANQDLMRRGIIENGFAKARVDGVTSGAGTATVNVTLLGGSLDRKAARFVLISKEDSGTKYWFLTRFELK